MDTNALHCRMQVPAALLHFKDKRFNVYTCLYNQDTTGGDLSITKPAAMNIFLRISFCIANDHGYLISENNMQLIVLYCTVLCCIVLCCSVLCCIVLCCSVLCCTVLHCTVLYCTVLCCAVLYCAELYCTVLYCTGLYSTVLYSTVLCCNVL